MTRDNLSLDGKSAIITGSGRENGHCSKPRAERVAKDIANEYGSQDTALHGAVDVPGTSDRLVKEALAAFDVDHIDILVNNSGVAATGGLLEATPEQLQSKFGLNVFETVYMTKSVVGMSPPEGGSYAASKAAQDSITASFAGELGTSRGITANNLAPGPVPTDKAKPFLENSDGNASAIHDHLVSVTRAANRMGTLEDIADAALLIVSEKARRVTAQFISVSGGINGTMYTSKGEFAEKAS
ncbi:hypothetical protein S40285_04039 [Stachybotrys chlorohalonatus IBT 40285]|uniref:Uncharacterized protein n=1 Tax=Stachybotrys chlorohalonatus (strain IBT 40285) TaxID=1283841 RepID=A0A084R088_STAC4|nr:hypothetical protein S40285_04039 [Stachybotrys chlorohalonata IBT 40285]